MKVLATACAFLCSVAAGKRRNSISSQTAHSWCRPAAAAAAGSCPLLTAATNAGLPRLSNLPHLPARSREYVFDARPLVDGSWRVWGLPERRRVQLAIPPLLTWLTTSPGRQGKLTGSFHPVDEEGADVEWTAQAYAHVVC